MAYALPQKQDRIAVTEGGAAVCRRLRESGRDIDMAKLLQETLEGASPLLCRELVFSACRGAWPARSEATQAQFERLAPALDELADRISRGAYTPTMVLDAQGEPKEFSFVPILQYQNAMQTRSYENISLLLDAFYGERDAAERMRQKTADLTALLTRRVERAQRKLAAQQQELRTSRGREELRMSGDLLSCNLHRLQKGMDKITLENLFDPQSGDVTIRLDPMLTPAQNIQKYYKDYRRADTAEKMLLSFIAQGESELDYLDTVNDLLSRASTEAELSAIRTELASVGYLRARPQKKKKEKTETLPPHTYRSSDGFVILAGRNNLQNDRLTFKDGRKSDLWLHVQKQAGSHVIVLTGGQALPERTIEEAAVVAAFHSRAGRSAKVSVDYTPVANVRRQPGAKPGLVFYENFRTAIVDPDAGLIARLAEKP
jgi:predicted ribosome quality control (RQC) complex YloA/Tae2 family protein